MFQIDRSEDVPSEKEEEEENGFEDRKDDSDDDGGGWITPNNIKQIQQELEQCDVPKDVRVGCVTTDFAMQVGRVGLSPRVTHVIGSGPTEVYRCTRSWCCAALVFLVLETTCALGDF